MNAELLAKAEKFRALHQQGTFLMPCAWDNASAMLFAMNGFEALGTTSGGVNWMNGRPDYVYQVSRNSMLGAYGAIARSVTIPVSGDLENGYGNTPAQVAHTITQSITNGMVGGSIEDHTGDPRHPLYDIELAVDRIRAAREAADGSKIPYTLTARSETYYANVLDPFREAIHRVNRYREAGADCLFVPGANDINTIRQLVKEVDGPISFGVGSADKPISMEQLAELGVRRVSTGGAVSRAVFTYIDNLSKQMRDSGSFSYLSEAISGNDINAFFKDRGDHSNAMSTDIDDDS